LQVEDILEDNKVITILEDIGGQVKSLQLKQRSIDLVEQRELAKDPPLEHACQDREGKKDAHKAIGGLGHDKQRNRRSKA
jgi:hypothetical protein